MGLRFAVMKKYKLKYTDFFAKTICGQLIQFRHTKLNLPTNTPVKLTLIIQALNFLGKRGVNDIILRRCSRILSSLDKKRLLKISHHLSTQMVDIIHKLNTA